MRGVFFCVLFFPHFLSKKVCTDTDTTLLYTSCVTKLGNKICEDDISLKLTAKGPENQPLEDEISFWGFGIFSGTNC